MEKLRREAKAELLSRLLTIYDCKVELKWTGKAEDGTEVKGRLTIPEVSHEITLDGISEYQVRIVCNPRAEPISYVGHSGTGP